MTTRIFIICLLGFMMTACGSDSDSGNTASAQTGLAQTGLDISAVNADAPPTNGQLPDELLPPGE